MATNLVSENKELKAYIKELEAENKARDNERRKLEEEVNRLSNEKKSSTFSSVKYQKLESYVLELEKKIKEMELGKKEA